MASFLSKYYGLQCCIQTLDNILGGDQNYGIIMTIAKYSVVKP
jgi:hypothetical protein